ncbi:hypothetical protein T484DRAFT_1819581, partial [Baffinella frigidus]
MIEQGLTAGLHTPIFLILCVFALKAVIFKIQIPVIIGNFEEAEIVKIQYQIYFEKAMGHGALVWLVNARVTGHADAEANCPRESTAAHARLHPFFVFAGGESTAAHARLHPFFVKGINHQDIE